jgi:hypothetical protein
MEKQILDRIKRTEQSAADLYGKVRTLSIKVSSTIGKLIGKNYVYVSANGTPTQNAIELQTAYNLAKTITGLSTTNRFKIIMGTGKYQFTGQFLIDTQYIDFVSLTGDADVEIINDIYVTANDVFLKGLKTSLLFNIGTNLSLLVCDTCVGLGNWSFGYNGPYVNSSTFNNCIGGMFAFTSGFGVSGKFTNCIGGDYSFYYRTSGVFTNCIGGNYSFGRSFASGTFNNCIAGIDSFGTYSVASGTFNNCVGGIRSFGGGGGDGILTGKLYYCRLTSGTFITVSNGGRTYYCVDGNGNTNNQ